VPSLRLTVTRTSQRTAAPLAEAARAPVLLPAAGAGGDEGKRVV
jgi:hypothetical protein